MHWIIALSAILLYGCSTNVSNVKEPDCVDREFSIEHFVKYSTENDYWDFEYTVEDKKFRDGDTYQVYHGRFFPKVEDNENNQEQFVDLITKKLALGSFGVDESWFVYNKSTRKHLHHWTHIPMCQKNFSFDSTKGTQFIGKTMAFIYGAGNTKGRILHGNAKFVRGIEDTSLILDFDDYYTVKITQLDDSSQKVEISGSNKTGNKKYTTNEKIIYVPATKWDNFNGRFATNLKKSDETEEIFVTYEIPVGYYAITGVFGGEKK